MLRNVWLVVLCVVFLPMHVSARVSLRRNVVFRLPKVGKMMVAFLRTAERIDAVHYRDLIASKSLNFGPQPRGKATSRHD